MLTLLIIAALAYFPGIIIVEILGDKGYTIKSRLCHVSMLIGFILAAGSLVSPTFSAEPFVIGLGLLLLGWFNQEPRRRNRC